MNKNTIFVKYFNFAAILKIFVLLSRVPYPLDKGDKLRAFHQLKRLSEQHEIYLFALNDSPLHKDAVKVLSFCKELHIYNLPKIAIMWNVFCFLFSKKPLQCGYFYNRRAKKQIDKQIKIIQPDHIYAQLIRTAEYVKTQPIEKTLDYQDVLSQGLLRIMRQSSFFKRLFYKMEHKRVRLHEKTIFNYFDNTTIITETDRNLMDIPNNGTLTVIPNGVDTDFYRPMQEKKKFDLIFTGNMSYPPNVNAAEYIAKNIFPPLLDKYPYIRIVLCGTSPSGSVLSLQNEHITVTGWVDDIRPFYAQSRLFIAPMHLGTGLQNKLLEAMAMKIPCITSPLASKPLHLTNEKEVVICNTATEYVEAIDKLLIHPELYHRLAENGYEFVRQNYNWKSTTAILEELINKQRGRV